MKEGFQGMEVIEKTRWEGDETVGIESVRRKMTELSQNHHANQEI